MITGPVTTLEQAEAEFRAAVDRVQRTPLPERSAEDALITPTLDDMAVNPGGAQALYRITYQRVGRRGGRDGSPAPAPLTVWATDPGHLARLIHKDVHPYLLSTEIEVDVDLEDGTGYILAGLRSGGTFTIEVLAVNQ
ncbi:hypothetical protein [Streptomyces sp. NRRL B-24484]|uniref:hypothetical protein n=1 Tax=Streptomyces sp. NRRL B-24484 TaxID=1463833 RepID=UPI0004C0D9F7|nr:hypothetical protein [Streptomyces sp. NRRL B-24484]